MQIKVATNNNIKVLAVKETIKDYPVFKEAVVSKKNISSGVSNQPKSMEETIQGAVNRASKVYKNCTYSFGLESGLMKVPQTKSGYMNICACVIFDGRKHHLGLGSAFEYPIEVTRLVFNEGLDINQAFYKTGLTQNPEIGSHKGAIGILTNGRVNRKDLSVQAIKMALIHLEFKALYSIN
ncbi:MAG: DUF84 family protein [Candidatus Moranbacteria bacterium]|nr:DUF84 family protein [Candidatus Moranbacteria bacterium]